MIEHAPLAVTPRERFLDEAQRELIAFERKERAFKKRVKREEAEQLNLPLRRLEPQ